MNSAEFEAVVYFRPYMKSRLYSVIPMKPSRMSGPMSRRSTAKGSRVASMTRTRNSDDEREPHHGEAERRKVGQGILDEGKVDGPDNGDE